MKFGSWLLAMCEPLLAKVLLALGFSLVTITGMDLVISGLKSALLSQFGALPAGMLGLFELAGGGMALGMILGAIATKIMLWNIMNTTKMLGVAPS